MLCHKALSIQNQLESMVMHIILGGPSVPQRQSVLTPSLHKLTGDQTGKVEETGNLGKDKSVVLKDAPTFGMAG